MNDIKVVLALLVNDQNINIGNMVEVKLKDSDEIIVDHLSHVGRSVHAPHYIYFGLESQPYTCSISTTAIEYIKLYSTDKLLEDIKKGYISKKIPKPQKPDCGIDGRALDE